MVREILQELFPPGTSRIARWRLAVFGALSFVFFHVAWACGFLTQFGLIGFAKAEEITAVTHNVESLSAALDEVKIQLLEQSIFEAKDSECTATDSRSVRFFQERVIEKAREYRKISGIDFDIPPCRNSGVR